MNHQQAEQHQVVEVEVMEAVVIVCSVASWEEGIQVKQLLWADQAEVEVRIKKKNLKVHLKHSGVKESH